MEEIDIIRKQLKKLNKKGISLAIVNDTICFIDNKLFEETKKEFEDEGKIEWDGLRKDVGNYAVFDSSKYIVGTLS
jgi:hypothetical protein